jgi:hypothetical protein
MIFEKQQGSTVLNNASGQRQKSLYAWIIRMPLHCDITADKGDPVLQ